MKKKRLGLLIASLTLMLSTTMLMGASGTAFAETPCEHEYQERVVKATCTDRGYTEYVCKTCGDNYKDNYVEELGHNFENIDIPATCTQKGFTTHYCKTCGYQYSDNYVGSIGHDYEVEIVEPTCIEGGYTTHTCRTCNHTFIDNIREPNGHTFNEDVLEATCTSGGHTTYHCTVCDYEYVGNEQGPKGHHFEERKVNATCVAYGFNEHICNDCLSRYVTDYVKPLGHSYRIEIVPASPDTLGYTKHICNTCGYTYLSDFSTSGDSGYIEIPEAPQPPVHNHSYALDVQVDNDNKVITVNSKCNCGDERNDLVNLLFANEQGQIQVVNFTDGVANYSDKVGNFNVSVVDYNGNILQEFVINNGTVITPVDDTPIVTPPTEDDTPTDGQDDVPTIGDNEHTHSYSLTYEVKKETNKIKLNYVCSDCENNNVNNLVVLFTDKDEVSTMFVPNVNGDIDFTGFEDKYLVQVINENGVVIKTFELNNKPAPIIEPEQPTDQTEPTDIPTEPDFGEGVTDNEEQGNVNEQPNVEPEKEKSSGIGYIIAMVGLVAGGTVTIILMKKKKNKKK